jgi:cytochrome c-type biogenesis protein CcmH/NrfF
MLWAGPLLVLLGGGVFLWNQSRRRATLQDSELSSAERQRLESLKKKLNP